MNKKHKFSLIVFFIAALALPAFAQHTIDPLTLGGIAVSGDTNNVIFQTTNVYDTVSVTRGQYAAIQLKFTAEASSTSNLTVRVDTSVDGTTTGATNWMPNVHVYTVAANGVSQVTHATNILVGAFGYLRINLCNANTAGRFTNIIARVATKPGI